MSSHTEIGTITKIAERKVISDKFTVQDFILHTQDGDYTEDIKFQASNKGLDQLKPELIGKNVKVSFNIKGRGVPNKGYFVNLTSWKIELEKS